jgi:hypothetical protein
MEIVTEFFFFPNNAFLPWTDFNLFCLLSNKNKFKTKKNKMKKRKERCLSYNTNPFSTLIINNLYWKTLQCITTLIASINLLSYFLTTSGIASMGYYHNSDSCNQITTVVKRYSK